MTDVQPQTEPRRVPIATKIGFGLWAVALLWWFLYYAQYEGAFQLLRLKIMCLDGATRECKFFQEQIHGGVPTYYPIFWWAGMIALVTGFFQGRAKRR